MSPHQSETELDAIFASWTKQVNPAPTKQQRADFRNFVRWCDFYGVSMPAEGSDIANFLLELVVDGASISNISRIAESIVACYEERGCPLHQPPIRAALAMAQAQLGPRTVN
jgi:hypothetical protein